LSRTLLAAAILCASAAAAAPRSVELEELTWTEVRDAIAAGTTTIIVPVGGTEQSGPHIGLGKHNARVRVLAQRIATSLGDALVAPVIAYVPEGPISPPAGHMKFPGTITVPDAAFESTLASAGRSFNVHGFTDVVFIGDHGGYQKSLVKVAQTLDREWGGKAHAHAIEEYYRAAQAGFAEILRKKGYTTAEIGTHAGLADTSLMLATKPDLVLAEAMRAPPRAGDGVSGDPRNSKAELGQAGADLIVEKTVAAIRKARERR
jgi:creatinine amidohydrolase/Fe(II)-dependent formamide hydrolase-like protein